jgi:hypothetical protein
MILNYFEFWNMSHFLLVHFNLIPYTEILDFNLFLSSAVGGVLTYKNPKYYLFDIIFRQIPFISILNTKKNKIYTPKIALFVPSFVYLLFLEKNHVDKDKLYKIRFKYLSYLSGFATFSYFFLPFYYHVHQNLTSNQLMLDL